MKTFRKIFYCTVAILILCFMMVTLGIKFYGKKILHDKLQSAFNQNVMIGSVNYLFPFRIAVRDLVIPDVLSVKSVVTFVDFKSIRDTDVYLSYVLFDSPVVVIDKSKSKKEGASQDQKDKDSEEGPKENQTKKSRKAVSVNIKKLAIKQGRLEYRASSQKSAISIQAIEGVFSNVGVPLRPDQIPFSLSGEFFQENNPLNASKVETSGWVNWLKRDMDALVVLSNAQGKKGLSVKAISKNNDMKVQGEANIANYFSSGDKKGEVSVGDIVSSALSAFSANAGVRFSFQTKMDDFQVGAIPFAVDVPKTIFSDFLN